jgi:hypothetical protein
VAWQQLQLMQRPWWFVSSGYIVVVTSNLLSHHCLDLLVETTNETRRKQSKGKIERKDCT